MRHTIPNSPFSTRLSGSAKETELRIRNIFQWKKKRPPVIALAAAVLVVIFCGGLVGFSDAASDEPETDSMESRLAYSYFFAGSTTEKNEFMDWEADYAKTHPEEYNSFDAQAYFESTFTNPIRQFSEDPVYDVEDYLTENPLKYNETVEDRMRGHWLISLWREEQGRAAVEAAGYSDFPIPYWKMMCCDTLEDFLAGGQTYNYNAMTIAEYGEMVTWMQDYLAQHPETDAAFDAEAYQRDNLSYPYGELSKYNWFQYRPMDYSEEDYNLEIKAIWLKTLYDSWKETAQEPGADANREVLDYVEALFENEKDDVRMQCFLLPGTGPIAVTMDEYKEQVRAVFARYTWTREEGEEPEWERSVDDWTLYLNSAGAYNIVVGSYNTWVRIDSFAQTKNTTVYYSYDGEPGSLNDALADLLGGPEIRYALVTLPENIAGSQTLAEAYADAFRELYLASGAITDYELLSVELLGEDPDPETPTFTLTYRVKPVDPAASCWEYYAPGEDGWATCSVEMHLTLAGYESAWVWRAGWWEYP